MLFTSPLCDVTPVVCQTEGRRCLMQPFFFSLFFFPDSSSLAFIFIFIFKRSTPTRCCDTAFLSFGWQCRSQGMSPFLSLSHFFSLSLCNTHTQSLFRPTSSIITPPSIHPGHCWVVVLSARAWRTQPLIYASPLWHSAAAVLFTVLHVYFGSQGQALGFSGGWEGIKWYFKPRKHWRSLDSITGHAWGKYKYHTGTYWHIS